ncbi:MAG: TrkH family potassium uptake protein [Clostridia bacterium]|nr:TrkH family potassium uptake protein [Clostridia bacterium]
MNYRMIFYMIGRLLQLESVLLLLPAAVCLIYGDGGLAAMLISAAVAAAVGTAMTLLRRPRNQTIYAKEGFVIVALSWLLLSAVGALPFVLSGELPSFVDAFFETVSGFTTTGATVATALRPMGEALGMSHGVLFWRSFTHWIGGMGVLVLMMALVPTGSGRTIHVMRAEVPGPIVGKLVPRLRDTAKILYLIYLAMTVAEILCLCVAGMPLFDSMVHTFGSAGTGGFGIYSTSIGEYNAACQWIITVFMWLFGVNFNVYYLLLIRNFRSALGSRELWVYGGITLAAVVGVTLSVMPLGEYATVEETVRHAAFQVSSIITTTGYATTDFNLWPMFARCVLVLLMFIGACAGSTGGGLKVSRVMLVGKSVGRELKRLIHPRSVGVIRLEGKRVEESVVQSATAYVALYFLLFGAAFLLLCLEPAFDLESNFTAVAACINNVGPGLGAVGPTGSYADYSALSKVVLSFSMLLGRLEIYPLVLTLLPGTWTKR